MNYEEFKEKRSAIISEITNLTKQIRLLGEAYIDEHKKYSVGDKIRIKDGNTVMDAVVIGNKLDYSDTIWPIAKKLKKDGTESSINARIWSNSKIEKL